jgi:formylglycine-generating enzyme required for sulfatase activity
MQIRCAILLAFAGLSLPAQNAGQIRTNSVDGLAYAWIPPGTFMMGCSLDDNQCAKDEKPPHQVTITRGFWIGQTPVTQEAYQRVTGRAPGYFRNPKFPVESVTWDEARTYCEVTGTRLPTEAEWEYAARAGTTSGHFGDIDRIAWYGVNSDEKTHAVGQKQPNAWGLYDMLGNVWEWTSDWYASAYPSEASIDPQGPASGKIRALRGGSWGNGPAFVRVSVRSGNEPGNPSNIVGFRCAGNTLSESKQ